MCWWWWVLGSWLICSWVRDLAAPLNLDLNWLTFVPHFDSWEPCYLAKVPVGPQTYVITILWPQKKRSPDTHVWVRPRFHAHKGWGFILCSTRIIISNLVHLKYWYLSLGLHGILSQNTAIVVIADTKPQISHSILHVGWNMDVNWVSVKDCKMFWASNYWCNRLAWIMTQLIVMNRDSIDWVWSS
jgi:hypothetical protein